MKVEEKLAKLGVELPNPQERYRPNTSGAHSVSPLRSPLPLERRAVSGPPRGGERGGGVPGGAGGEGGCPGRGGGGGRFGGRCRPAGVAWERAPGVPAPPPPAPPPPPRPSCRPPR